MSDHEALVRSLEFWKSDHHQWHKQLYALNDALRAARDRAEALEARVRELEIELSQLGDAA